MAHRATASPANRKPTAPIPWRTIGNYLMKSATPFREPLLSVAARAVASYCRLRHPGYIDDALTIFVYHDVSHNPSEFSRTYGLNVPPRTFEYQLAYIKRNFNIIGPLDLFQPARQRKAALITFDDGFSGFFSNAVPILRRHRVPCIAFLNMATIKGGPFWSGLITYLCDKNPDFVRYLKANLSREDNGLPLFLACTEDLVRKYLKRLGSSASILLGNAARFTGAFGGEKDLSRLAGDGLVYFGNHLFDHHVPITMSDEQLVRSYRQNAADLEIYPNYVNMLSMPFGQPGSCYTERQVDLLFKNGVEKVFHSSGRVNHGSRPEYLDRIALTEWNDSPDKIQFQIVRRDFPKMIPSRGGGAR